jgi:ferric-dicitrate binding protein FerR (iron transport regulator)
LTPHQIRRVATRLFPLAALSFFLTAASAVVVDSSAVENDAALVVAASGRVSTEKNGQDWAIGEAERIGPSKPIFTGPDGYARFLVEGGSSFELFAHSKVVFRKNMGNPQDLLDVITGHVAFQLHMSAQHPTQARILTPVAAITAHVPAAFRLAVDDEDNSVRIDVQQGAVLVQHTLLPSKDPILVKAGDAIAVSADTPLVSRQLDRGSLYRYTWRALKTLGAVIPGRSNPNTSGDAQDQDFLARNELVIH